MRFQAVRKNGVWVVWDRLDVRVAISCYEGATIRPLTQAEAEAEAANRNGISREMQALHARPDYVRYDD